MDRATAANRARDAIKSAWSALDAAALAIDCVADGAAIDITLAGRLADALDLAAHKAAVATRDAARVSRQTAAMEVARG